MQFFRDIELRMLTCLLLQGPNLCSFFCQTELYSSNCRLGEPFAQATCKGWATCPSCYTPVKVSIHVHTMVRCCQEVVWRNDLEQAVFAQWCSTVCQPGIDYFNDQLTTILRQFLCFKVARYISPTRCMTCNLELPLLIPWRHLQSLVKKVYVDWSLSFQHALRNLSIWMSQAALKVLLTHLSSICSIWKSAFLTEHIISRSAGQHATRLLKNTSVQQTLALHASN